MLQRRKVGTLLVEDCSAMLSMLVFVLLFCEVKEKINTWNYMGTAPSSNSLVMIIFYFVIDELEYSSFLSFRGPFSVPLACFPLIFLWLWKITTTYSCYLKMENLHGVLIHIPYCSVFHVKKVKFPSAIDREMR